MMDTVATYGPTASLIFFFCVFVGIALWALRPSVKQELQNLADIPLKEEM